MKIQPNTNPSICGPCGGQCCKNMPGIYSAGQVRKGKFDPKTMVIDIIERKTRDGYMNYRVIRPRGEEDKDHVVTCLYPPNRCMHLTDQGCGLPWEKKPLQCKALIPSVVEGKIKCTMMVHAKDKNMYNSWKNRQKELEGYER